MILLPILAILEALALTLSCSGCELYGSRPQSPDRGGAPWQEITSPHFRVLSDLSIDEAEATARELEQGLDALVEVAFAHSRNMVEPTTIVVFRNHSELHAFVPGLVGATYSRKLPNDLEPAPVMLTAEGLTDATRATFYHELTHDLFARNFGWSPPWLSEGWAQYYSTLRVEKGRTILGGAIPNLGIVDGHEFYVGRKEDGALAFAVPVGGIPRATALMEMDASTYYAWARGDSPSPADLELGASLYVGSWALVHMMLDGGEPYTPRFKTFLRAVSAGDLLDQAWKRAFADLPGERIDRDFRDYLKDRKLALWESPYEARSTSVDLSRRVMTDSEVRLLWARLVPWNRAEADKTVAPELDDAIAKAPHLSEPHYWRGVYAMRRGDFGRAEDEIAKAISLVPGDPRLWLAAIAIRISSQKGDSRSAPSPALLEAIERLSAVAVTATQLRIVASAHHELGQSERGLELASRAIALAPIDPYVLDTYAELLFDRGRAAEAAAVQRRAVANLPDRAKEPRIFEHLQRYQAHVARQPLK